MTLDKQRIAIAEFCGWTKIHQGYIYGHLTISGYGPYGKLTSVPNYPSSLDAMHEAEKMLHSNFKLNCDYAAKLTTIVYKTKHSGCRIEFALLNATAPQRAEAFLRTIGKWEE